MLSVQFLHLERCAVILCLLEVPMVEKKALLPLALIHVVYHLEDWHKVKPSISALFSKAMKDSTPVNNLKWLLLSSFS